MARKPISARQPWHPFPWYREDVYAMQAVAKGIANEAQQKRALDWIIRCAGTYAPTFHAGKTDVTHFAEGSRHVGMQIVHLINMPASAISKQQEP